VGTPLIRPVAVDIATGAVAYEGAPPVPTWLECTESGGTSRWPTVTGAASAAAAAAYSGAYGLRLNPTNGAASVATSTTQWPQTRPWASLAARLRLNTLPGDGVSADLVTLQNTGGVNHFDFFVSAGTGRFAYDLLQADAGDTGITPVTGVWYLLEAVVYFGAATYEARVRVNGVQTPTITSTAQTPASVRSLHFGTASTTKTYQLDVDEVMIRVDDTMPAWMTGGVPG
jgi:hypothetical protein